MRNVGRTAPSLAQSRPGAWPVPSLWAIIRAGQRTRMNGNPAPDSPLEATSRDSRCVPQRWPHPWPRLSRPWPRAETIRELESVSLRLDAHPRAQSVRGEDEGWARRGIGAKKETEVVPFRPRRSVAGNHPRDNDHTIPSDTARGESRSSRSLLALLRRPVVSIRSSRRVKS